MRSVVFIPVKLLQQARDGDWLRSVAYLVRLKALYKNNTHYQFSLRSLADRLHCSPSTLAHHLRILEQYGTLRYHGRNLTFLGLKPLSVLFGQNAIGIPVDPQNQLEAIRAQLIRINLKGQSFKMAKSGIQQRCRGAIPGSYLEKTNSSYVGLSCKGVGRVIGLSRSSGARVRGQLIKRRILKRVRRYTVICEGVTREHMQAMKLAGSIKPWACWEKGRVFEERRSELKYLGK